MRAERKDFWRKMGDKVKTRDLPNEWWRGLFGIQNGFEKCDLLLRRVKFWIVERPFAIMLSPATERVGPLRPSAADVLMTAICWHSHSSLLRLRVAVLELLKKHLLPQTYHSGTFVQAGSSQIPKLA
jgi:hypothetical protein